MSDVAICRTNQQARAIEEAITIKFLTKLWGQHHFINEWKSNALTLALHPQYQYGLKRPY